MSHTPKYYFFNILICWTIFILPIAHAGDEKNASNEDTMLIFVGENLEVLSIASRREESAWQAPAVAEVITRKEIQERGAHTLSEALTMIPGFYMARKEWGTQPYLRGIPDSILFLYDTVPICSDITKSLNPLNYELSLSHIKRIEIIRGPGSVLWGPDAFAGIVNVVPMTGKDLDGLETGVLYGLPGNQQGVYLNAGYDTGLWDAFLSVSARRGEEDDTACNIVKFWGDGNSDTPVATDNRLGEEYPDVSHYVEASGRFSFREWLTLSGRISDNKKFYAMSDSKEELTWLESRSTPFHLFKLEATKHLDHVSALRITGSYSYLNAAYDIIDRILEQEENTTYIEGIYNRSFFAGKSLFTGGISYRKKRIKNAPSWESYLPEYLSSTSLLHLPLIGFKDYDTELWSFFSQYNHKISNVDLWVGVRYDAHDTYQDRTSFNAGWAWSPSSQWIAKMLYGTAYRTPFARQLLKDEKPDLENIQSLNLQLVWKPTRYAEIEISPFISRIENHIKEDPYAGLSLPNSQNIGGVEVAFRFSPLKDLELSANFTLTDNTGPDEIYKFNYHTYTRPDGTEEKYYIDLSYPYDSKPDSLCNFMATWRATEKLSTFLRLGYFSSTQLVYPHSESPLSIPGAWTADMSTTIRDILLPGMDLEFSIKNLADRHYEIPGTYNTIEGNPFSVELMLRKRW